MTNRQRYGALALVVVAVIGAIALIEIVVSPPDPTVGVGLPGADEAQTAAPTQAVVAATVMASPPAAPAGTTAAATSAPTAAQPAPPLATGAPTAATSAPIAPTSVPAPVTSAPTPAPTPQVVVGQLPELPVIGTAPEFAGVTAWLNSEVLTMESLRGRPVLIDFWTFGCINCIRTLPHVRAWHDAYAPHGLVIVGVHTPEFRHEYEEENVRESLPSRGVIWPVAMDNGYKTWRAYNNRFWPHKFLIDQEGRIRYHHIGEGAYQETEKAIRALLAEGGNGALAHPALQRVHPAQDDALAVHGAPVALCGQRVRVRFVPGQSDWDARGWGAPVHRRCRTRCRAPLPGRPLGLGPERGAGAAPGR